MIERKELSCMNEIAIGTIEHKEGEQAEGIGEDEVRCQVQVAAMQYPVGFSSKLSKSSLLLSGRQDSLVLLVTRIERDKVLCECPYTIPIHRRRHTFNRAILVPIDGDQYRQSKQSADAKELKAQLEKGQQNDRVQPDKL